MTTFNHRLTGIAGKEFLHIIHDPRSLLIIFLMPVIQLVMFGYALNLEIQKVNLIVIDHSNSVDSKHLADQFSGSRFFNVSQREARPEDFHQFFLSRQARAILIIPHDFSRRLQTSTEVAVQVLIDAAEPNAATLIRNYCNQVILAFNRSNLANLALPFEVEPSIWYNPDMKSSYFFVPGLLALILVMICALLTSIAITREKEMGTLEQILVSPVRPHEIILGKVIPYVLIALLDAGLILLIGIILFDVPFIGSLGVFVLLTTLYILTALSLGLMISTIAPTQQVAIMVALVATLLPTIMLSGFIFPIQSMPKVLQLISNIIPAKYYLLIVRGILLKGNLLSQLTQPTLALVVISSILLLVSVRKFKLNLET